MFAQLNLTTRWSHKPVLLWLRLKATFRKQTPCTTFHNSSSASSIRCAEKISRFQPKWLQLATVRLFQDVCLHGIWFLLLKVSNQGKIIKQYNYKRNVRPQSNIKATRLFKTAPARNESQTSFRKDGLWLAKMGHWKGKQIIYSCVDLMVVFVPLVTLPFQMSEELIWAVSERTTWRRRGARERSRRDGGFRRSELGSRLWAAASWIRSEEREGTEPLHPVTHLGAPGGEEKPCMCGERAEVGGHVWRRTSERKKPRRKDSRHRFICQGVGWCKQTRGLCKLLILWTVKSPRWRQEN